MPTRHTKLPTCACALFAAVFAALLLPALAPAKAKPPAKPKLVVTSPTPAPALPGRVRVKASLRAPRSARIKSARFFVNGKLVTKDRKSPFAVKRGVRFDTRSLPTKKPYVTIVVKYRATKPNGKPITKSLKKRIRIAFAGGDVDAKGGRRPPMEGYALVLDEQFNGDSLDRTLWNDQRTDSIDEEVPGTPAMSRPFNVDEGAAYGPENVSVADGLLKLVLSDTPTSDPSAAGYDRSTGMVNTKGKFAFKYGYVETRAWVS